MKGQRYYEQWQEDLIYDLYVNQKRGLVYISKIAHTTPNTIKKFLKSKGIHIRTFSEATISSNQNRALYKNKEYFNTENSNMAWLLGFLASDGYIAKDSNKISINLAIIDKEILEQIKSEVEIENNISEYITNDGFKTCSLSWTCAEHKKALEKYGIIPQKTFVLKSPDNLNKKYWIDYIRGYFDGDGSISYINSNNSIRWQVCSATPGLLNWIVNFLYEQYKIPKVNIQKQDRNGSILYYIQYSTNATKKIYNILYTSNSLYLKRKKEKFDEIIKMK